jgi:hypothetical protein
MTEQGPIPEQDNVVLLNSSIDILENKVRKVFDKYGYDKVSKSEAIGLLEVLKFEILCGDEDA